MNWYKIMYYFTIAGKVSGLFQALAILCTIAFGISLIIVAFCADYRTATEAFKLPLLKKLRITTGVLILPLWVLFIAVPNQHDLLLIVAGGSVGQFVEKDSSVQQLPHEVTLFLKEEMGKQIHEVEASDTTLTRSVKKLVNADSLKHAAIKALK